MQLKTFITRTPQHRHFNNYHLYLLHNFVTSGEFPGQTLSLCGFLQGSGMQQGNIAASSTFHFSNFYSQRCLMVVYWSLDPFLPLLHVTATTLAVDTFTNLRQNNSYKPVQHFASDQLFISCNIYCLSSLQNPARLYTDHVDARNYSRLV